MFIWLYCKNLFGHSDYFWSSVSYWPRAIQEHRKWITMFVCYNLKFFARRQQWRRHHGDHNTLLFLFLWKSDELNSNLKFNRKKNPLKSVCWTTCGVLAWLGSVSCVWLVLLTGSRTFSLFWGVDFFEGLPVSNLIDLLDCPPGVTCSDGVDCNQG